MGPKNLTSSGVRTLDHPVILITTEIVTACVNKTGNKQDKNKQ
jgi:hypothetical protein